MQTFEPDQLVLVRYFVGAPWRLRRYSMPCKKGKAHETQDGMVFVDACIIPYYGNEHLLGTTESPGQKWEPKPGELVAVKKEGFDHWVMAQFKCKCIEGGFIVTNRDDRRTDGSIFDYCEPLRKHFTIPEE